MLFFFSYLYHLTLYSLVSDSTPFNFEYILILSFLFNFPPNSSGILNKFNLPFEDDFIYTGRFVPLYTSRYPVAFAVKSLIITFLALGLGFLIVISGFTTLPSCICVFLLNLNKYLPVAASFSNFHPLNEYWFG